MKNLMAHLVACYPDEKTSLLIAKSLVEGGADILEVQLPFSDPNADGSLIQNACSKMLETGKTVQDGLNFIQKIHQSFPNVKIALMSYGSLVFTPGVENFCQRAKNAGVDYMIIPDLPFDCDEGLSASCKKNSMINVPVAAPDMSEQRFTKMMSMDFPVIYAVLRSGITGTATKVDEKTISFLKRFRGDKKVEVYGGFGIQGAEQASAISPYVDGVVAGSVFLKILETTKSSRKLKKLIVEKVREIKQSL